MRLCRLNHHHTRILHGHDACNRPSPVGERAFTLIEVVVTIAIIALLAVLLMPVLKLARSSAQRAGDLSNLRSHVAVFTQYAGDFADQWPYFTDPQATYSVIRNEHYRISFEMYHFLSSIFWNIALADAYYDGEFRSRHFVPAASWSIGFTSPFEYSCSFIARPEYWNRSTRLVGAGQWGSTRIDQVLVPEKKVLILETLNAVGDAGQVESVWAGRNRPAVGMTDGSASMERHERFFAGYFRGDGVDNRDQGHLYQEAPPLHTIDGVRGRDLR